MMILVILPIFASCIFCVTFVFIDNSAVRSFPYAIFICYLGGLLSLRLSLTYSSHFLTVGIPQDSVFRPLTLLTVCTFFHLHASIYMIKSSKSSFLVVEYNTHYQLSIKVKCHCNYYDSVSCSHLYLLLSTYH